jgi:hypothetical protein
LDVEEENPIRLQEKSLHRLFVKMEKSQSQIKIEKTILNQLSHELKLISKKFPTSVSFID